MVKNYEDMTKEEKLKFDGLKKTQVAWIKEYAPDALTPEEIIEKIVKKEIEVPVEVIKFEEKIVEKIVDNPEHLEKIEKLELDVQGLEDIITDKNKDLNDLNVNLAASEVTISEYQDSKKEDKLIIKALDETILKLKKAVKELST